MLDREKLTCLTATVGLPAPGRRRWSDRRSDIPVRSRASRRRQDPTAATDALALGPAHTRRPSRLPHLQRHDRHVPAYRRQRRRHSTMEGQRPRRDAVRGVRLRPVHHVPFLDNAAAPSLRRRRDGPDPPP